MQGARAESPTRPFLEPPLSHSGSRSLRIDCHNAHCSSQPQFAARHRWRLQQRRTAILATTAPASHHHSHRNHRICCCPCQQRQRQHQQQPQISTLPIATLVAASGQGLYVKPSPAPLTIDDQFSCPFDATATFPGRFPSATRLPQDITVRSRLHGCASLTIPTASYDSLPYPSPTDPTTVINAPVKPRPDTLVPQKHNRFRRLSISLLPSRENPAVAAAATLHSPPPPSQGTPGGSVHILQSPFRRRPAAGLAPPHAASSSQRTGRLAAARLWNPTNSTPRAPSSDRRRRRLSTPPPPAIPLRDLDSVQDPSGSGTRQHPLLTLPEQWQARHSTSTRHSFTLDRDRRASSDRRVSLPRSVRASYDGKRSGSHSPIPPDLSDLVAEEAPSGAHLPSRLDKGKGKEIMTAPEHESNNAFGHDLERGPDVMDPRTSNVSYGDGIGSAISSSNSSIMGEDVQFDGEEWGPLHPCFPHINPHVPIDSPEHTTTRIIRIRRDWLQEGDLAPTFSILYPEILDPAGLSEQEFRRVIDKVNREVVPAFSPHSARNLLDGALGLVTGWLWDDLGLTAIKSRLNGLEKWIETWNAEMEKSFGSEEGLTPPKLISLRRTGYMSLDIQISDPEITREPSSHGAGESNTALSLEAPAPAVTAL